VTSLRLGLRLAITPAARLRTALLAVAAMLGAAILLVAFAAGHHQVVSATSYQTEMPRLVAAIIGVVGLPCAVLVATVARLSASLRDRRLANLRLIGLTANQTRLVGTGEAGGAALLGALLGWGAFWLVRPLLLGHAPAGPAWGDFFVPTVLDQVVVVVGVPALAILASVAPARSSVDDALAVTRRADRRPPGWWRLLPLAAGIALCLEVVVSGPYDPEISDRQVVALFAGVGLTAVGMLLVLPVLVRLLTRVTSGRSLGPAQRIAVRRLEAQPAGVARIIAALLVGLFLATGARFVLVAFESTPQYVSQARGVEQGQRVTVLAPQSEAADVSARLADVDGVRDVVDLPTLTVADTGVQALVATCADLARVAPTVEGCRDGEAMWLNDFDAGYVTDGRSPAVRDGMVTWSTSSDNLDAEQIEVVRLPLDLPTFPADRSSYDALAPVYAGAIIPPSLVGDLPAATEHTFLVVGGPGRGLDGELFRDGFFVNSSAGSADYDFVATMRSVIWIVAGVVLAVGLLALTVSTIDRGAQRRKEIVALQLVGLGRGVLRRAQGLETAVPVVIGSVLAVGLGALSGATYLSIDDSSVIPWEQTLVLGVVAVAGGLGVALVSMISCAPRVRPEEIRAE
jgi:putative ABC transport system permease protein